MNNWLFKAKVAAVRTQVFLIGVVSNRRAARKALHLFITPRTREGGTLSPLFREAEPLLFTYQDMEIHGYRWNAGAGKKALILHGFESSITNFEAYIQPLIDKGYEVLGFDAPAHGRSGGRMIHALDYKNVVQQILERYGPITSFITHSFGGQALSLVLETIPHTPDWKVVFIAPATELTTAADYFFNILKPSVRLQRRFLELIAEMNKHPLTWYSLHRAAPHIQAQVLFLVDDQDTITPIADVQPIMDAGFPNFSFIITSGLGHSGIYRHPDSVKSVIQFL